jgi:hypothetical protein
MRNTVELTVGKPIAVWSQVEILLSLGHSSLESPDTHSAPPLLLRLVFFIYYINSVAPPDCLTRKPSTRGQQVDHSVTTRCSHACLALTAHCQRAGLKWTACQLLTDTRKFVYHAAFTLWPRGMLWLSAQRLLVIKRYPLVYNEWTPCAEAVQRGCRVALMSCDLVAFYNPYTIFSNHCYTRVFKLL